MRSSLNTFNNLIINYVVYKEPLIYLSHTQTSEGLCKEHTKSSRKLVFNAITLHNTQNKYVKDQW
jgi:hypothetical protein